MYIKKQRPKQFANQKNEFYRGTLFLSMDYVSQVYKAGKSLYGGKVDYRLCTAHKLSQFQHQQVWQ